MSLEEVYISIWSKPCGIGMLKLGFAPEVIGRGTRFHEHNPANTNRLCRNIVEHESYFIITVALFLISGF